MRYFFVIFFLSWVVIFSVAGFRGCTSRRPPLELFPDMVRQPKLRPQSPSHFFADQRSSRVPPLGTVAFDAAFTNLAILTGRVPGTTNFIEVGPFAIDAELLARGQERYQIYCLPCHGPQGDGKGITAKYGVVGAANFHDPRLVRMPAGEIFQTMTYGKNLMPAYGPLVSVRDRWAIIAYLRALERSWLGNLEDVPAANRPALMK
jgi:mono/diheme cytochrome c family protein